ncbi:hypothetical protein XELAEV_18031804mg [Xenopus laevis]|uniref:SCAN box domain-containing protein n=1 Tax=Xenopus laevis TaxID=8355 RepID=A0A974CQN2_XENLA|nr:hypothetical protein XELAEV_18031804mg [Xenopus laevis]
MDRLGLTPEAYRQRFRAEPYSTQVRPRVLAQQFMDFCTGWIQPAGKTADQVIETVVLEQFLLVLPVEVRQWVQRHQAITLPLTVQLVENYLLAEEELNGLMGLMGSKFPFVWQLHPGCLLLCCWEET